MKKRIEKELERLAVMQCETYYEVGFKLGAFMALKWAIKSYIETPSKRLSDVIKAKETK